MYRNRSTSMRSKFVAQWLVDIDQSYQVWATAVPYIPMTCGFLYRMAVIDWFSCRVLSERISNCMTVNFCVEALEEATHRYGAGDLQHQPRFEIYGDELHWHSAVASQRISMEGRGAWRDNVFVERPWKSVEYEEIDLHAYDSVAAAKSGIRKYFSS